MYIRLLDIHNEIINCTIFEIARNLHKVMCIIYKGIMGKYILYLEKIKICRQYGGRCRRRRTHTHTGLQLAQQEFTWPARRLPGVLWHWALVLVTAPCFCRRWSLSWLLCLKWRSHFSHWGKVEKILFRMRARSGHAQPQATFIALLDYHTRLSTSDGHMHHGKKGINLFLASG